jgi:hypothetical protein
LPTLCIPIFTEPNLRAGHVTLMAVDVGILAGTFHSEIVPEIRRILSSCIHPSLDVLLPMMKNVDRTETFFIVACANTAGCTAIEGRIKSLLQTIGSASNVTRAISSTTLLVEQDRSWENQKIQLYGAINQLILTHLGGWDSDGRKVIHSSHDQVGALL